MATPHKDNNRVTVQGMIELWQSTLIAAVLLSF